IAPGVQRDPLDTVLEAAQRVHAPGPEQLAQQIDEPGSADALRRPTSDHTEPEPPVVVERDILNRALQSRHTAGDGAPLERGAGGTRCRKDAMTIAHQQLGVRTD